MPLVAFDFLVQTTSTQHEIPTDMLAVFGLVAFVLAVTFAASTAFLGRSVTKRTCSSTAPVATTSVTTSGSACPCS